MAGPMAIRRRGQRHRDRSFILRQDLYYFPTAAQQERIFGDGHRACHLQEDRGTAWGEDLGGTGAAAGEYLFLYHYETINSHCMTGIHILLVDDNEGDILLTREALGEARIINRISVAYDGVD